MLVSTPIQAIVFFFRAALRSSSHTLHTRASLTMFKCMRLWMTSQQSSVMNCITVRLVRLRTAEARVGHRFDRRGFGRRDGCRFCCTSLTFRASAYECNSEKHDQSC